MKQKQNKFALCVLMILVSLCWTSYALAVPVPGLTGEYFNNDDLTSSVFMRVDDRINFRWRRESPDSRINSDTFSVRWTGLLLVSENGNYEYRFRHNDGVRCWIDGALIVESWTTHRNTQESIFTIFLEKGPHEITIEYFENTQKADMRFYDHNPKNGKWRFVPAATLLSETIGPVEILTQSLQEGRLGIPYQQTFNAQGGFGAYQWEVVSGILSAGLTINSNSGVISGTPTQSGIFQISIQVSDDAFQTDEKVYQFTIGDETLVEDLFVDNEDLEFSVVGPWGVSSQRAGFIGANYHTIKSRDGANKATWALSILTPGRYEVFANWSSHNNHASNAPYTVHHSDGSAIRRMDQRANGGQWNSLGFYSYNTGVFGVVLSDDTDGFVIADAVKMESYINNPPLWNPVPLGNATVNVEFQMDVSSYASDFDEDLLTFSKISGPAWIDITSEGILGGTPATGDIGSQFVDIEADDGFGGTAVTTVTIDVTGTFMFDLGLFQISDNSPKGNDQMTFDTSTVGQWKTGQQYIQVDYDTFHAQWAVRVYTDNVIDFGVERTPLIWTDPDGNPDTDDGWLIGGGTAGGAIGVSDNQTQQNRMQLTWMITESPLLPEDIEDPVDVYSADHPYYDIPGNVFDPNVPIGSFNDADLDNSDGQTKPDSWNHLRDVSDLVIFEGPGDLPGQPTQTRLIDLEADVDIFTIVSGGIDAVLSGAGGFLNRDFERIDPDQSLSLYIAIRFMDITADTFQTQIHIDFVHF